MKKVLYYPLKNIRRSDFMKVIFIEKERFEEKQQQKEKCLEFLYYLEDIFDYKWEVISNCINELQELDIRDLGV